MGQVLQFNRFGVTFDSDVAAILVSAYEKTIAALHDGGQPELLREIIAKQIIAIAEQGERDPDKLSAAALERLGINR